MQITKRDGRLEDYNAQKIKTAIQKSFKSVGNNADDAVLNKVTQEVEKKIIGSKNVVSVEHIQDLVEETLMKEGFYTESKSYILYRSERAKKRKVRQDIVLTFEETEDSALLLKILKQIQQDFLEDVYSLDKLEVKYTAFVKLDMSEQDKLAMLVKAAVELTTQEAPKWEFIAARLLMFKFKTQLVPFLKTEEIDTFYKKILYLTNKGLYGRYILEAYTKEELDEAASYMKEERNHLLTYSGLDLLLERYVIRNKANVPLETPQEMFLGIALHLAMKENKDRLAWVQKFYNMLSELKVTMATPTLSNARKPFHQLSSCFIDTVPDSLTGIYRSIDNFAQVSKYGGGMGLYFGKVRAKGSAIRGFEGAAGGVVRWIRLANDTAVAVDQLGVRQGAVAVYLDAWHKDLPEFLALRTNNGDERMKAHDVFPAVCFPELFWKMSRDEIEANWYLMCPHEIQEVKGYALEDTFGQEWEDKYRDCIEDERISKRVVPIKELVRLIIKSAVETGTPFIFNRDAVNTMNPNNHKGIIYCSNLCTEIAQNMSSIETINQEIKTVDGETVVVNTTKPGDFVVCNLASLSLGHINVTKENELEDLTKTAIRALDNVIDLNFYPVPYAEITNKKYRPVGLGVSGYHHMLANNGIAWESNEHLEFVDKLFERINFAAISSSTAIAQEKGSYSYFTGSDWQTGRYFEKRNYTSLNWQALQEKVEQHGMRNAWLLAIAPTSSTSILSGTTAGIDPIMNRFFLEEKKNGLLPRLAPNLSPQTYWYYKNAYQMDQRWSIRACGVRQRHIDQAQSMNLYITTEYTFRQILDLYVSAFESGVKTIYYVRSKSLEVEECESCSS